MRGEAPLDEQFADVRVAAGGRGVQRRPQLRVGRVHGAPELQQQAAHGLVVVDAALQSIGSNIQYSIVQKRYSTESSVN